MNNTPFPLTHTKPGDKVRILKFDNSSLTREKLQQYGLFAGDTAQVMRIAPFEGPILLSVKGREIALGESIAAHILVERVA
jgi:ferrous iron transport protein A